ncbi:MAG TPA: DUF5667 domain-containing protein [Candidatus Paceibacterota bacterium]|jgi:hypothetical protein
MQTNEPQHEYSLRELRSRLVLSDETRARMRAHLSAYADFHAVAFKTTPKGAADFWSIFRTQRWHAPGAALLIIALMGAGTTYASGKSLPGDALYMVKINVAEPLSLTLSPTVEGRANVHVKLAERRLTEATKLAVGKQLDSSTGDFLEREFSTHVDKSLAAADTLEAKGNTEASLDIRTTLEAKLVAHADILDLVEDHLGESGSELARAPTQHLLEAVKLRQEVVSETRVALEKNLENSATPAMALALVTKTDAAVPEVNTLAQAEALLPASAAEHMSEAADALTEAKESLESTDPAETKKAFRKAREAELKTEVANVILENQDVLDAIGQGTTTPETTATTTPADPATSTPPASQP